MVGKCTTTEVVPDVNHMCSFTLFIADLQTFNSYYAIGFAGEMSFADGGGGFLPIESFAYETIQEPVEGEFSGLFTAAYIDTGLASFTYTNVETESPRFVIDFSF